MTDRIDKAICELHELDVSCVVVAADGKLWSSDAFGIKPLMMRLREDKKAFLDCVIADRVVGKAAALLAVLGGAVSVYGEVMSDSAVEVFRHNGVECSWDTKVPYIENRTHTGRCPMEAAVLHIEDPTEAFGALEITIQEIMEKR